MRVFYIAFCLACICMPGWLFAQQDKGKQISFSSINGVGLLTGQSGQAAILQSINGVKTSKWFAGVGTGIDYYGTRSIPLFLDVRHTLGNKTKSPFFYADGGINFPWITTDQKLNRSYIGKSYQGVFLEGGAGLQLIMKNKTALLLSAGYSYKEIKDEAEMVSIWIFPNPIKNTEIYRYHYRRIAIKLALQF